MVITTRSSTSVNADLARRFMTPPPQTEIRNNSLASRRDESETADITTSYYHEPRSINRKVPGMALAAGCGCVLVCSMAGGEAEKAAMLRFLERQTSSAGTNRLRALNSPDRRRVTKAKEAARDSLCRLGHRGAWRHGPAGPLSEKTGTGTVAVTFCPIPCRLAPRSQPPLFHRFMLTAVRYPIPASV